MSSAIIYDKSGSPAATVDSTSTALRTTLYDAFGAEVVATPTQGSFLGGVLWRHTGTPATDSLILSFRNPIGTGVIARVRAIRLQMMFDGTSPGAQGRGFYTKRTTLVSGSITSGTAVTPTKKRTADAASIVDLRFDPAGAALTVGSIPVPTGDPMMRWFLAIDVTGKSTPMEWPLYSMRRRRLAPIELKPGDGLGIYNNEAATVGEGMCGYIEWDEGL